MFIQTEVTPNPATLKFLPGNMVMERGTANFVNKSDSGGSPLASRLFDVEGVAGVFLGSNFITATKLPDKDWDILKPLILSAIMDHYTSGDPVIRDNLEDVHDNSDSEGVVGQICQLLDTRVRPAVAQDGGDILFRGYEDGIVYLTMHGACAGCPSSTATLKHGIENMLKYYIPEIKEVRPAE